MRFISSHQVADAIEAFFLDMPMEQTESTQSCINSVVEDLRREVGEWEYELIDDDEPPQDILDEIQIETAVELSDYGLEEIMGLTHLREID